MSNNWIENLLINSTDREMVGGLLQILLDKEIFTEKELAETIIRLRHGINEIEAEEE